MAPKPTTTQPLLTPEQYQRLRDRHSPQSVGKSHWLVDMFREIRDGKFDRKMKGQNK